MPHDIPRWIPPDSRSGRSDDGDPPTDPSNPFASGDSSVRDFLRVVGDGLPCSAADRGQAAQRRRIGRFEVIEELGRGTFGLVLRVFDTQLLRERAMKLPHERTLASSRARARFLNEMRYAASIEHPNVVRMDEPGEVEDVVFQVMEYCPDGSLAGWLERRPTDRPLPPEWAALLVAQVADGVQAAHARRIIHRDLKPANILLARVGENDGSALPTFCPKVGDFGMAKVLDDPDGGLTEDDAAIGTLAYMSPEQARGDRAAIGPPSDIHALGAILYELLTRHRVYPGADRVELRARIIADDPPASPRTIRRDVPRELEIICRSCLAKDPRARYATAAALSEDLRRFHRGDPVRGTPLAKRAVAAVRSHGGLAAASVALGLAVALGAGIVHREATLAASVWIEKFENAGLDALPRLIADPGAAHRASTPRLEAMFATGTAARKLLAAVALADRRADCAEFAYEGLLAAAPAEVGPLTQALATRLPRLADRLASELAPSTPRGQVRDPEALDRRRANAAASLVVLGNPGAGLGLLRSAANPQARSFLIHTLGPAGAAPLELLRLIGHTDDPSVRIGLIQSLGEVPASAWTTTTRDAAAEELLDLYQRDQDGGVHGAAKWVLRKWGQNADLASADDALMGQERPGFRWRVSRSGLTFVQIEDPVSGRTIEMSDTEITRALFLVHQPNFHPAALDRFSPDPDCPITSVTHADAAGFCNWLGQQDGAPGAAARPAAYRRGRTLPFDLDPQGVGEGGFRLPTTREFEMASRAGCATTRYHGDSAALLPFYAWSNATSGTKEHPVALLKPNDLGLFDTLGNAAEITQNDKVEKNAALQAVFCGGGFMTLEYAVTFASRSPPADVRQRYMIEHVGFRVARTLPRDPPPASAR